MSQREGAVGDVRLLEVGPVEPALRHNGHSRSSLHPQGHVEEAAGHQSPHKGRAHRFLPGSHCRQHKLEQLVTREGEPGIKRTRSKNNIKEKSKSQEVSPPTNKHAYQVCWRTYLLLSMILLVMGR